MERYVDGFIIEGPAIGWNVHPKGGVSVPGPTPEETAIRQKQLEAMDKEAKWMDMFEPMVLDAMGYKKEISDTTAQTETPEYAKWKSEYDKIMGGPASQMVYTGEDNGYQTLTREEAAAKLGAAPTQFSTTGAKTESLRRMTEEERLANMTASERADYEIQRKIQQRELDALEGKLPISPALESTLNTEQSSLENELATKLGPNWKLSTPATTKLGEFKKRAELVREEARRGLLDTTSALNLAQGNKVTSNAQTTASNASAFPTRWGGLLQGYNTVMQPYQQDRAYNISASMQSQANKAAQMGGLASMLGTGGGIAAGMIFSSPKMKKHIKKADEDEVLDMVKDSNVYEYNYKDEKEGTPKRVGYMADEAPGDSGDGTMLDLGKVTGLHAAAIKAMAKKITKLEKQVKEN